MFLTDLSTVKFAPDIVKFKLGIVRFKLGNAGLELDLGRQVQT